MMVVRCLRSSVTQAGRRKDAVSGANREAVPEEG